MLRQMFVALVALTAFASDGFAQSRSNDRADTLQRLQQSRVDERGDRQRLNDEKQFDRVLQQRQFIQQRFERSARPPQRSAPIVRNGSRDSVVKNK